MFQLVFVLLGYNLEHCIADRWLNVALWRIGLWCVPVFPLAMSMVSVSKLVVGSGFSLQEKNDGGLLWFQWNLLIRCFGLLWVCRCGLFWRSLMVRYGLLQVVSHVFAVCLSHSCHCSCWVVFVFITVTKKNEREGVSNHQPQDCLLNRLFRHRSNKASKLCVTSLCLGNTPVTGEFPAQRASNAESVSIWWRHHVSLLHRAPWFVSPMLWSRVDSFPFDAFCHISWAPFY